MKESYPNIIDAITNDGYWGTLDVEFPFSMVAMDTLIYNRMIYEARIAINFNSTEQIDAAIGRKELIAVGVLI